MAGQPFVMPAEAFRALPIASRDDALGRRCMLRAARVGSGAGAGKPSFHDAINQLAKNTDVRRLGNCRHSLRHFPGQATSSWRAHECSCVHARAYECARVCVLLVTHATNALRAPRQWGEQLT